MEKHDIFEFTASNGVVVTAVVLDKTTHYADTIDCYFATYLCYAQNRLFEVYEASDIDEETGEEIMWLYYNGIVVEYCILPEQDKILEDYYNQNIKNNK